MGQNSNEIKSANDRPDLSIASTCDLYYAEVEHIAKKPLPSAVKLEDVKYQTKKRVKDDAKKSKEEAKKRTHEVLRKLG